MNTDGSSWTRALMASSGIAIGHDLTPRHASPEWYEATAADTTLHRVQKLAMCKQRDVRAAIARRIDCPMGVLASLAFDHDGDVRVAVAGNPRITEAVSAHLARDRDANVVKALARNHAIDLAMLQRLALHKKDDVRRVASRNLDERVHGSDGSGRSDESRSLAPSPGEVERSTMPLELVDRVATHSEWLPTEPEEAREQDRGDRIAGARQLLPRLRQV